MSRYDELIEKRRKGTLTKAEKLELAQLGYDQYRDEPLIK
jgi:hypothetical protein